MAIRDKAMTEPMMYPCLKCGGYGPTNHDPDCPNKPTTEPTMTLPSEYDPGFCNGIMQSPTANEKRLVQMIDALVDTIRRVAPPSRVWSAPEPAPGDVMSEDVLKAISFLRNDAYGCAWIAELIERLTADSGVGMDELREHIAVLEKALRLIQHEAAFAIADSADGCGVGWKRIEREARAALADTGKAQS